MHWANFLHIYQPANQIEEIFERVVNECYRPLVQTLKDDRKIKINLNINGALTEQLQERGFGDVVEGLRLVSERGQVEFTDSAKYHALLPFLPKDEVIRQIKLNRETNKKFLGEAYNPTGFFPPEMAYDEELAHVLEELGYKWLIIDEIALNGRVNQIDATCIYSIKGTNLNVFFRERNVSNLIMSALVRREQDLRELMKDEYLKKEYLVTGMDGETFGHHRPGLQKLLTDLLASSEFNHVFISELPKFFSERKVINPITSTWASSEQDIENHVQFLTWKDPQNIIHTWQWQLQELALGVAKVKPARGKLDQALASDHFFWASARPWWSLEVIESGAWGLLDAIQSVPNISPEKIELARDLYLKIIAKAFEWQRTGYVRKIYKEYKNQPRIPFKDKTEGAGEPWVYKAFVELMRQAMKEAAAKESYEEAIVWRDAIWKLETRNDIFEAVHAVDILRKQVTNAQILDMIGKYRRQYERLISGQPEQRG